MTRENAVGPALDQRPGKVTMDVASQVNVNPFAAVTFVLSLPVDWGGSLPSDAR